MCTRMPGLLFFAQTPWQDKQVCHASDTGKVIAVHYLHNVVQTLLALGGWHQQLPEVYWCGGIGIQRCKHIGKVTTVR